MYNDEMVQVIIFDFSRVLLFPKDKNYQGGLNDLYKKIIKNSEYNFFDYFSLNHPLLTFVKNNQSNYSFHIFTSEHIQKDKAVFSLLTSFFKNIFSASDLGLKKNNILSYIEIAKVLKREPKEILYIDDNEDNIQAATEAGLTSVLYTTNEQLLSDIRKFIDINVQER